MSENKGEQEDWRNLKRELMQLGIMPSEIGNEDYFEFLEILKAKPKEERVMSAKDAHARLRGG